MKNILMFLFTTIMINSSYAQYGSLGSIDARSLGLAGSSNSVSSGVYSIGINPANLAINKNNFIDFTTVLPLPSISISTGTNFLSLNDVNYFFGGVDGEARVLTEADKQRFNSLIQNGGLVFINASFSLFSFGINLNDNIGALAFSIQDIAGAKLYLPQALADVVLNGNPQGKTFNLNEANVKAWWIRNYSFSYARNFIEPNSSLIDRLTVGITGKLIHGYSYIGTDHASYNITTGSSNEITGSADLLGYSAFSDAFGVKYDFDSLKQKSSWGIFPTPAGTGFGIDFGIAAMLDNWTLSVSLTDIGKINWNKNAAEFSSFGEIYFDDLSNKDQMDSLENLLTGDSKKIDKFSTGLPTTLRFGTSYLLDEGTVPGSLLLAFDYDQGFNDLPGNTKFPRVSLGAEWKPMDWIPYIRTGISYNFEFGINWGVGLGIEIKIVELNFACSDMQSFIAPNQSKQLSFSFGSYWKLN
jgi:hypothetical protein